MNVTDFSTLYKLIAITDYILKFVVNLKENHHTGQLTAAELQQARKR